MAKINLPYGFTPRPYQLPLLRALDNGIKRAFWVVHRRAGKDITLWNWFIKRAFEVVGTHYYLFPTYAQARKVIWEGMTNEGKRFLDFVPPELILKKNDTDLKIELENIYDPKSPGSIVQLIGTDHFNSIRGTNPLTVVFSEFAYQNPQAWEVVRPILKLNGGTAVFNTTPNGENHAYELFEMAKGDSSWFTENLSINQTGLLTDEDMMAERREGMSEEMIQQEYYNSWAIGALGAYYVDLLNNAQQRITGGIFDYSKLVYTAWDLGFTDDTVCLFYQKDGQKINIIDVLSDRGKPIDWYLSELKLRNYRYANHYLPHDAFHSNLHSGVSTVQMFHNAGFTPKPVPMVSVQEGIQCVRKLFPRFYFEKDKTPELIQALKNYQREYDPEKKTFKKTPVHSWASHWADALRYLALGLEEDAPKVTIQNYGFQMQKGYAKKIFR